MNEDDFVEEWAAHYPTRKMYYSEAANYLRAKQPPPEQPVEQPDQLIPQSNLRQRSQPGYEDIPAMPDPRNMPDTLSDDEKPGMVAQFIKTIYPQAQLDDNIIAGIVGDFARPFTDNPAGPAMAGGVRDLGQGLVDVASEVSDVLGLGPIDVELPQIESADEPAAHLVRGMTQFFAGFGAAGGLAKGASFMRQTLAGAAADVTFDPELGNLSTLLREQFNVDNALVDYLDAKVGEDADALERLGSRVKMVLEGGGIGALIPATMAVLRSVKLGGLNVNPNAMYAAADKQAKRNGAPEAIQAVKDLITGRPGNLKNQLGMVSWHGTPHKWESGVPDLSKVGTGEGAQAYGHGIYFAENPEVGGSYTGGGRATDFDPDDGYSAIENELADLMSQYQDAGKYSEAAAIEELLINRNPSKARSRFSDDPAALAEINKHKNKFIPGNLYKVDIPDADIDRMLDWDKPLSEQSDSIQKAASEVFAQETGITPDHENYQDIVDLILGQLDSKTGKDLYQSLTYNVRNSAIATGRIADTTLGASQAAASASLKKLGIPGIKYLDQGSRGKYHIQLTYKGEPYGEPLEFLAKNQVDEAVKEYQEKGFGTEVLDLGTRNFVVFDEELLNRINVLDGDGKPTHHSTGQVRDSSGRFKKVD